MLLNQEDIYEMFNLPLWMIVVDRCNHLSNILDQYNIEDNQKDEWAFPGKPGKYPTTKVYLAITNPPAAPTP
jgi:hypothetical protein